MITTWKRSGTFIHTITSGDAAANLVDFDIASGSAPTNDFYFIGQVRRDGVDTSGFNFTYTSGNGILRIADEGAVNLTENDVVVVMGSWVKN